MRPCESFQTSLFLLNQIHRLPLEDACFNPPCFFLYEIWSKCRDPALAFHAGACVLLLGLSNSHHRLHEQFVFICSHSLCSDLVCFLYCRSQQTHVGNLTCCTFVDQSLCLILQPIYFELLACASCHTNLGPQLRGWMPNNIRSIFGPSVHRARPLEEIALNLAVPRKYQANFATHPNAPIPNLETPSLCLPRPVPALLAYGTNVL